MDKRIVSEIWIYPIKSLGGIELESARVLHKGLEYDRRWMIVDEHNVCMTQRVFPVMALFKLSWGPGGFSIHFKNESLLLPFTVHGESFTAQIWDDKVEVYETDPAISEWFTEKIGVPCRLVAFPEKNTRPIDDRYAVIPDDVSLADGYPLLIIGQNSLNDLNNRMKTPSPMNRFRPNIVFTGGTPYEEDSWREFRIGNNRFVGVKPCARCVLTTVDQDTAEKGKEPLVTLATYRREGNNIYFGQNLVVLEGDVIKRGEELVLLDT
jgi:hypothetical protein